MDSFLRCLLLGALPFISVAAAAKPNLPVVDLGYELHQASFFNETGGYFNFSNIRYGREPTGDLRWNPPQPPLENRQQVQSGDVGRICPQAWPVWYLASVGTLSGDKTALGRASSDPESLIPPPDPREMEDCLFLDVVVPDGVFARRNRSPNLGAPVMVWFYGGGFTFTDPSGNPAGLIERSKEGIHSPEGVIYVKMNYRGGAFGFLSGSDVRQNGSANVGLLDQRLALEWVQSFIHLFGGDPSRVTVFGQSAGAGSIMHQITAYGGLRGPAPFQQAILSSPGFQPLPSSFQQEQLMREYLSAVGVTTIEEARKLPFQKLQAANIALVANSSTGLFTFSPVVDGSFAPALPGQLLLSGGFDKTVRVMTSHMSSEAQFFIDPSRLSDADFRANLQTSFPAIQPSVVSYIAEELYPPITNSSRPGDAALDYDSPKARQILASSEASFTCNTRYLASAFTALGTNAYAWRFALPPGYHGQDVPYIYFNGPNPERVSNETVALMIQGYLTEFAASGSPNRPGLPSIEPYGEDANVLELSLDKVATIVDPNANERCRWWQKGLYY